MPDDSDGSAVRRAAKAGGPQSPRAMYEALKYIMHGPNGGPDSDHLATAAYELEAHHRAKSNKSEPSESAPASGVSPLGGQAR